MSRQPLYKKIQEIYEELERQLQELRDPIIKLKIFNTMLDNRIAGMGAGNSGIRNLELLMPHMPDPPQEGRLTMEQIDGIILKCMDRRQEDQFIKLHEEQLMKLCLPLLTEIKKHFREMNSVCDQIISKKRAQMKDGDEGLACKQQAPQGEIKDAFEEQKLETKVYSEPLSSQKSVKLAEEVLGVKSGAIPEQQPSTSKGTIARTHSERQLCDLTDNKSSTLDTNTKYKMSHTPQRASPAYRNKTSTRVPGAIYFMIDETANLLSDIEEEDD